MPPLSILFSSGSTISSIVIRQALPPTALEMGSAMKTPSAPKWKTPGRRGGEQFICHRNDSTGEYEHGKCAKKEIRQELPDL